MTTTLLLMSALALITGFIALAKRRAGGKRRSMGRYVKGNIDEDFALGTLAANTAVLEASDVVGDRMLISSVDVAYTLAGFTAADNVGPVEVGFAHSDYTLAEIEGFLELTTSWNEGDLVDREISGRKIRRIGVFDTPASAGESYTLNDGKPIKTKLNWILNAGQGLNWWVYNQGGASFATTDPNMHITGHANLWPR